MTALIISVILLFSPGGNLKDEVGKFLKEKLSYYESFEFEIIKAPAKNSTVEIMNRELDLRGNIIHLPVSILTNGRKSTGYISIKIKLFQNVMVAVKPVSRGEQLSASSFELQKMEVTGVRGTPVLTEDRIDLYRSKSTLRPGSILLEEYIEPAPVILSGNPVNAHSITGNVDIVVEAFARQDGAEGDIIRIITKDKKLFKARIIDAQNVQILE